MLFIKLRRIAELSIGIYKASDYVIILGSNCRCLLEAVDGWFSRDTIIATVLNIGDDSSTSYKICNINTS